MHELAITEGVIAIVNSEAEKQHFTKVLSITLKVGEYSGIIPDCVREFFPIASAGSIAEGAELEIEPIEAEFKCLDCSYSGKIERSSAACPECGSTLLKMTKGREFYVENIKVE